MTHFWDWLNRSAPIVRSLQASLDDANATISRVQSEKAARDRAIIAARDALDAVLAPAATDAPRESAGFHRGADGRLQAPCVEAWEDGPPTDPTIAAKDAA